MVLHVDRLPFKIRTLVWSFWGEPSRVENFWKECWETGWLLLKWISFAFLLEILIVAPIPAERVTQWFGGDGGRTIPFNPTIVIPAYLNDYAVIPLVAGLIEKRNGTGDRDGFHGNRRCNF
jgi:hypothetical protein